MASASVDALDRARLFLLSLADPELRKESRSDDASEEICLDPWRDEIAVVRNLGK